MDAATFSFAIRVGVTALDPIMWLFAVVFGALAMLCQLRYRWAVILAGGIFTGALLSILLGKRADVTLVYAVASMLQIAVTCLIVAGCRALWLGLEKPSP